MTLRKGELAPTETAGADYSVKVTIRNGLLLKRIREAGYRSVAAFCRAHGLHISLVQTVVSLKRPGINPGKGWRKIVVEIADILQCMPQDIVPEQHWHSALKRNAFELDLTGEQAAELVSGQQPIDAVLLNEEKFNLLEQLLQTISPRSERIVRLRFGIGCDQHTSEEVAHIFGVSPARVIQIEQAALRRLRHRSRAQPMLDYLHN
jgi:RNA polymerase sigma factor (sigma-70 family)